MDQLLEKVSKLTDGDFAIVAAASLVACGWMFSSFCRLIGVLIRGQPTAK